MTVDGSTQLISILGYNINIFQTMALVIFAYLVYSFDKARRKSHIDWMQMLTTPDQVSGEQRASATKLLQLLGAVTSSFIVIKLTLQNLLTWDILGIYLTYVAGADGFSRYMLARYGVVGSQNQSVSRPQPPNTP